VARKYAGVLARGLRPRVLRTAGYKPTASQNRNSKSEEADMSDTTKTVSIVVSVILFIVAACFLGFGSLWVLSAFTPGVNAFDRLCVGGILVLIALAGVAGGILLIVRARAATQKVVVEQKIDLTGDVKARSLTCEKCGATLDENSVSIAGGAVFVKCPYCGATYQIVEQPKW